MLGSLLPVFGVSFGGVSPCVCDVCFGSVWAVIGLLGG